VVGLGGDDPDRRHGLVIGALNMEGLDHRGQDQGGLGQCKLCADAHARTDAERQISEAVGRRCAGQKPHWVKHFRLRPQPPMPVQHPGRDEQDRGGRDRNPTGVVGILCLPHHGIGRGIEAHRLVHDCARIDEPRQDLGRIIRPEIECLDLRGDPFLDIGRRSDEPERPEQRHSRRLVTGGYQSRHLIEEGLGRERSAALRISRHRQQIKQVMRSRLRGPYPPLGDDAADQGHPPPPNPSAREIAWARDPQWQQEVEQGRAAETLSVAGDQLA
jgi:hypothetical protein